MVNAKLFPILSVLLVGVFFSATSTNATVYSWRDEKGRLHFCNDEEEVPEAHRVSAQTFTSKLAAQKPVEVPVSPPSPSSEPVTLTAYERGLERGLQTAEYQVALAG